MDTKIAQILRWIEGVPLLGALYVVVLIIGIWWARLFYPFDLEWMEGGMLAHAWRLQQGLALYESPSPAFIPYIYPPGYPWLLAILSKWTELGPTLGRSVSLISILLTVGAMVFSMRNTPRRGIASIVGIGIFLGCYRSSGAFYDLVRPDSLALGLLAWALVLVLETRRSAVWAAGLLLAASFMVKHTGAIFGLPMLLLVWSRDGRRSAIEFVCTSALPALVFTAIMQWSTEGHFLGYLLSVPAAHPFVWERAIPGIFQELGSALPVAVLIPAMWITWRQYLQTRDGLKRVFMVAVGFGALCLVTIVMSMPPSPGSMKGAWWALPVVVGSLGMCGVSWGWVLVSQVRERMLNPQWMFAGTLMCVSVCLVAAMRGHHGGFLNVYMPLHFIIAWGFAWMYAQLPNRTWIRSLWMVGAAVQLWMLSMSNVPDRLVPSEEDVAAGQLVVEGLKDCRPPILSPFSSWLPTYAGFAPSFHLIALWDIHHSESPYRQQVRRIDRAVRKGHWGCIIDNHKTMGHGVKQFYTKERRLIDRPKVMSPKTGWRARPELLLVPANSSKNE